MKLVDISVRFRLLFENGSNLINRFYCLLYFAKKKRSFFKIFQFKHYEGLRKRYMYRESGKAHFTLIWYWLFWIILWPNQIKQEKESNKTAILLSHCVCLIDIRGGELNLLSDKLNCPSKNSFPRRIGRRKSTKMDFDWIVIVLFAR